jgi:tetratricopeptide (TPR) repeat protein
LTILACVAISSGCSSPETKRQKFLENGNRYFAQEQYREAIIEYRNAVQIDPKFGEARAKLAESYARTGDAVNALNEFVRAADLLPERLDLQLAAGNYLLAARRPQDALARAEAILSRDAKHVAGHVLRGNALGGLNNFEQALTEIEEAIELDPSSASTYTHLGLVQVARGQRDNAEVAFKKAVELDPKWLGGHLGLGNFYWAAGRLAEAELSFENALRLDPDNAMANRAMAAFSLATRQPSRAEQHLQRLAKGTANPAATIALADFYQATGRPLDAIRLLEPLAADNRNVAGARHRLSRAYAQAGDGAKARALVDRLLRQNSADSQARLIKGQLLLAEGKREDALEQVRAAVDAEPASVPAQFALGRLYAARGDAAGAEKAFREVLRLNPRAAGAQLELSRVQLSTGSAAASLSTANEALKNIPGSPEARLALVRSLIATRAFEQAQKEARQLLVEHPKVAGVHVQAGVLAAARNDMAAARAAFEQALALDPESLEALTGLIALDLRAGNTAAARGRIDARVADTKSRPAMWLLAARVYVAAQDPAAAERILRRTIQADPTLLPAYAMLGQIFLSQKRLDEARGEFESLAQRQSHPVAALTMAGMILHAQGKIDLARERFEQVLAIDPRAPVASNNLAWLYAEAGENLDAALRLAQVAAETAQDVPEILDTLGWVYYKKNLPQLALEPLTRCVEKDPSNPTYHYHLGLAYLKAGDEARGRSSIERALALRSDFSGADDARRVLATTGRGR